MKRQLLAAVAALCFISTAIVPAAVAEVPITLNAGVAQWYFNSDRELRDMSTPWAGFEWAFNDNWATEFSYAEDDASSEAFRGTQTDVRLYNLGLKYYGGSYIGEPNRVRPFVSLGAGLQQFDPKRDNAKSNDDVTVNGGLGFRWMITRRFGASVQAGVVYNVDKSNTDGLASLGLNYYLGAVTPKAAPMAEEPAYEIDSDGDGVPDDVDACLGTPAGTRVDSRGCPLPVTRVASIRLKVNFGFDSTEVQQRYFADLGELAAFLKRFEDLQVKIEGHTDSTGPESYNKNLSQRRALAVVDMLVNKYGIAANRLQAFGFGESDPVATNATRGGRAENRRVMASLEVEYEE